MIDGEEEECALGPPVTHLSFIVHGIGEAMWSRKDVSSPCMIDEVNHIRKTVYKKMIADWKVECKKIERQQQQQQRQQQQQTKNIFFEKEKRNIHE